MLGWLLVVQRNGDLLIKSESNPLKSAMMSPNSAQEMMIFSSFNLIQNDITRIKNESNR
jgi:hypothetical protein